MENRLARSPVNYPLATSIAASALTMLVVTGSLLIAPWQKCTASNQSNRACLQSEFILLLSPIPVHQTSLQPVGAQFMPPPPLLTEVNTPLVRIEETSSSTTKSNISPLTHIPQFPDFILPRPEPEVEETIPAGPIVNKEQTTPDFVAFQMSAIQVETAQPPLPWAPKTSPTPAVKLEEAQIYRFSSNKIIVQNGDNLWTISSQIYGAGRQYIRIFEANKNLISSPHKIFPGQVLALPEDAANNHSVTE